ncbi:hypothetical protein WJX72_007763 [[Myrmecia] bisecta]|uniref:WW domain-containing protein n=1 Tax=[Myrmecia] bisecta TaxID=41462 RepID=A0AAW1R7Z7_9CHLO
MNEAQAAEYYQEQKEKGSGAHLYKQGLGFTGPPGPRPSAPPGDAADAWVPAGRHAAAASLAARPPHAAAAAPSAWERPAGYKGDAAAAGKQAVPVASLPVKGTQWTEVACQDGQKYYYHTATQETTWSMPEEVRAAKARTAQGPSAISAAAAAHISRLQAANGAASHADGPEEDVSFSQDDIRPPWEVATAAAAPQPTAVALQPNGAPPQHPHPHSHPHAHPSEAQPHEAPANIQPPLPSAQPHGVPGDALRPSTAAPAAAAVPPPLPPKTRDDLEREFKDLLIEKGVTAFSRWERELPKLITDPRYKALPTLKDRRLVFDNFCKNVAEEHRQRQAHKAASVDEDFRALLEEALMPAAETAREAAEGGEPEVTEEAAEAGASGRGGAAGEETGVAGLGPDATLEQLEQYWGNDPRWKACDDAQRQRLFAAHVGPLRRASQQQKEDSSRALLAEFRALLAESGVDAKARWSKTKDQVGSDARYRGLPREEREPAFRAYVAELQAAAEAARKERKEAEERDREARKRSAREAEAAEARRKQAAHADAVAAYQTLLMEVVKDAAANWRDWKPRLERDPQGRAANPDLPKAEVESLFRDHVRSIADQNRAAYISLLDEVVRPLLPSKRSEELPPALSSFVNARGLMQDDPRFSRLPESQQEYEWRKFVGDLIFERDNPAAAAAQRRERENGLARAGGRGLPSERERERRQERSAQDAGEVTDKAYQREYLDHDRKRIKRD